MSLLLCGPRRTFALIAFCECLRTRRRRTGPAPLLHETGLVPGPDRIVHRLHGTIAGWVFGLTFIVIDTDTAAVIDRR